MANGAVQIRESASRDRQAVVDVVRRAFGRDDEADLVTRLMDDGAAVASLVAEAGGAIVGHALLSNLGAEIDGRPVRALALGPISVRPTHQRRGIASRLVEAAIHAGKARDAETIIVLGDPGFYDRFGFSTGRAAVFSSPYDHERLLAIELIPGALSGSSGTIAYPKAFDGVP